MRRLRAAVSQAASSQVSHTPRFKMANLSYAICVVSILKNTIHHSSAPWISVVRLTDTKKTLSVIKGQNTMRSCDTSLSGTVPTRTANSLVNAGRVLQEKTITTDISRLNMAGASQVHKRASGLVTAINELVLPQSDFLHRV